MIVRTPDEATPEQAFELLHLSAKAAALLWCQALLRPAKTPWDLGPYAIKHALDEDARHRLYLTEAEFRGALLAAGFRVDQRGLHARPLHRRYRRRFDPHSRRLYQYGVDIADADDDTRLAFETLVRDYHEGQRVVPRDAVGVRRHVTEEPVS